MKVERVTQVPSLYISEIITFDPWPFSSPTVAMADEVRYIDYSGELHSPGSWALGEGSDNRLALLNNSELAVLSDDFNPSITTISQEGYA